jgi:membrane protease YdiL (CAAX protease family)
MRPGDYAIVPLGVMLLFGLNIALESVQRQWFPDLWASDQRVSQLIASGLTPAQMLMLGLSAGIGEEITLRGALQPRLGLLLTSLLFAALHIQYSWFGMGVIFSFGLLLGFLRNRTSTTVVMAIHTLYDVVAVATIPGPTLASEVQAGAGYCASSVRLNASARSTHASSTFAVVNPFGPT